MTQEERYGQRDLTYSQWHRARSTGRYIGIERAQTLAMIDMDHTMWVEYDDETKEPLALIEEALDIGQSYKCATVTENLARKSDLPALLVLWLPSAQPNPAAPECPDIERFRVKRLWPKPESDWRELSPLEYAKVLVRLRVWQTGRLDEWLFGHSGDGAQSSFVAHNVAQSERW